MGLVSITPLPSQSCLHKLSVSSTHELKPLRRTTPILGMCRRRKSVAPAIIMCSKTAVSDGGIQRRTANHHANLWDDDFIQSLSTPYQAPSYLERAERLIGEVKEMLNSFSVEGGELYDLIQRLSIVDTIERLGIDRHFKKEIKSVLDYVYSYWNETGIGCGRHTFVTDLNSTALGFRIFRLHQYPVSSDVLEHFKDKKGQFVCSSSETGEMIRSVLNLFRASLVAFPSEKVMEEAEIFCKSYLKESLQKIPVSSLSREIEFVMEYGWHTNLPRLEARNYIDIFGNDIIRNEIPFMNPDKLLELAKLEFNIFHSLQLRELQHISRWWKDSSFSKLTFVRHRHVEFYTLASCITNDPNHSAFRLCFAKTYHLITVIDDIYDTFGTMEELKLFTTAVKRWDMSAIEWLPEYMKGVYRVLYETVNEMAREADKSQPGRNTRTYARQAWEDYIDSFMKEAKWISTGYIPTFDEYYENGKISFGYHIIKLQPMLMLDIPLPQHILQEFDFPSKFIDLAAGILRLKGDTHCYKAERARGESASSISCYMKDNLGLTEEDALNDINIMVNNLMKELNWELLKRENNVPISFKKMAFDIARAIHHGYIYRDGYSDSSNEIKKLVMITVLETVPL